MQRWKRSDFSTKREILRIVLGPNALGQLRVVRKPGVDARTVTRRTSRRLPMVTITPGGHSRGGLWITPGLGTVEWGSNVR